jgi:hypothetical protein
VIDILDIDIDILDILDILIFWTAQQNYVCKNNFNFYELKCVGKRGQRPKFEAIYPECVKSKFFINAKEMTQKRKGSQRSTHYSRNRLLPLL